MLVKAPSVSLELTTPVNLNEVVNGASFDNRTLVNLVLNAVAAIVSDFRFTQTFRLILWMQNDLLTGLDRLAPGPIPDLKVIDLASTSGILLRTRAAQCAAVRTNVPLSTTPLICILQNLTLASRVVSGWQKTTEKSIAENVLEHAKCDHEQVDLNAQKAADEAVLTQLNKDLGTQKDNLTLARNNLEAARTKADNARAEYEESLKSASADLISAIMFDPERLEDIKQEEDAAMVLVNQIEPVYNTLSQEVHQTESSLGQIQVRLEDVSAKKAALDTKLQQLKDDLARHTSTSV